MIWARVGCTLPASSHARLCNTAGPPFQFQGARNRVKALLSTGSCKAACEIGRASGRGRGVDLGGRRIIKKKKRKKYSSDIRYRVGHVCVWMIDSSQAW